MLGWGTRRRYTVAMVVIVRNFHLALYTQGEVYVSPPTFCSTMFQMSIHVWHEWKHQYENIWKHICVTFINTNLKVLFEHLYLFIINTLMLILVYLSSPMSTNTHIPWSGQFRELWLKALFVTFILRLQNLKKFRVVWHHERDDNIRKLGVKFIEPMYMAVKFSPWWEE